MLSCRVLDLSDERGMFCAYLLRELGADVVRVEPPPPAGSPPPSDGTRSSTWWAYARSGRHVVLDLATPEGRAELLGLAMDIDVVVESADPGTWEAAGLGWDEIAAVNPAVVWVSITAFGSHGPKAGYAATDLVVQAAAGALDMAGPLDRAPVRTAGITAWAHAGAEAAGGALIALESARRTGTGQRVEVSAQRAKNLAAFFNLQAERIGHKRVRRSGSGYVAQGVTFPFVWPAKDGFVSLTVTLDEVNKPFLDGLLAFMREEDAIDEDLAATNWPAHLRLVRSGDLPNTDLQRLADAIGAFLANRTKADLMAAALDRRLLLVPVSTVDDLLASPQLEARGYWRDEATDDGTRVRVPARVVKETVAPGVGAAPPAGERSGTAPLAGLRVLDLMWVMAGPTSTGVLAQYGATVVRVENAGRIDSVRLLAPYYEGRAGRERSLPFASINAAKLSLTLDLTTPEARDVVLDLVRWADVVTESFSPKAMKRWGLDYESLRRVKPDLVMLSSCLFGQDGPYALMAGYGTMGAAIGGMIHPTGWPDQPPAGPYGAYTDVCAPRISTAALLAALDRRRRTGQGAYLDQSQIETSLLYMLPAIVDAQRNGTTWDRLGNDDAELSPHAVYPSLGDDWVAVAVRDAADWRALATAIGRPDWAVDDALADVDGRRRRREEIDRVIGEWTARRSPEEAEAVLQRSGVPAHAVLHAGSPPCPQLEHLRHTVTVPHQGQPDRLVERTRIELTAAPPEPSHVPAMGQHTEHVLGELLGYPPERIAALRSVGALGGEPDRRRT
jgi:crotonobetainyl-CoA:carnitine CoA-transferase CaiB-like acyl-CoA transferase